MSFTIETPPSFRRSARRFFRKHPDLRARFAEILRILEEDPFRPSLRLHPLGGELQGQHAVWLTHKYRITLTLLVTERTIVLLDIGTHDEVYP